MTEAWFNPELYAWIPGVAYGIAAGVMGGLVAVFAPKGKARSLIVRSWFTLWVVAVGLLAAGFVALASKQPWGVWFALLLPGVVGTLVVGANSFVVLKTYQRVEARRLAAKDFL